MVSRALAQHAKDAKYRDSALSAATTLLKVKAYADAQQILDGLRAAGTPIEKDPPVALISAAALQGQGRVEDAQKILAAVARENPRAGEVHLAAGRLQQQLQQWEPAAAAYRAARKELTVGGEPWWQATVGLAESLAQQGNSAGAQELLRVANAMYRNRAPASLLPRIDTLLKQPPGAVGAVGTGGTGGRNG
jgi:tetratricopeptide (TPR) repeat protein